MGSLFMVIAAGDDYGAEKDVTVKKPHAIQHCRGLFPGEEVKFRYCFCNRK
jgi:hypothetical protein